MQESLQEIEDRFPTIAQTIRQQPWLRDGITEDEQLGLSYLVIILGKVAPRYPDDLRYIVEAKWLPTGITRYRRLYLEELSQMSSMSTLNAAMKSLRFPAQDPEPPRLDFPWAQDELTLRETEALIDLEEIKTTDPAFYQFLLDAEWLADGTGFSSLDLLREIARDRPRLAQAVMGFQWLTDDITNAEYTVLNILRSLDIHFPDLTPAILGLPWLAGDITHDDAQAMSDIQGNARSRLELVTTILNIQFVDGQEAGPLRRNLMHSLNYLCYRELDFGSLDPCDETVNQPWFQDGLTDEEAAKVIALNSETAVSNETIFLDLLRGGNVESESLSLPSGGKAEVFVVSRSRLSTAERALVFQELRFGIEALEGFMETPWPEPATVVYLEPWVRNTSNTAAGYNQGSHIEVRVPITDEETFRDVLYHELGHFVTPTWPTWLSEGTAEFLASYTLHLRQGVSLQQRYDRAQENAVQQCHPHGLTNVPQLVEAERKPGLDIGWPLYRRCSYPIGESFVLGMYLSLGHEAVSSALLDLHLEGRGRGNRVGESQIYESFLANTPPGKHDEFRDLYRKLHGGPIPDS